MGKRNGGEQLIGKKGVLRIFKYKRFYRIYKLYLIYFNLNRIIKRIIEKIHEIIQPSRYKERTLVAEL